MVSDGVLGRALQPVSTVADFKAAAQAAAGSTDLSSFWAMHRVEG